MRLLPLLILIALISLCSVAIADQVVPFAPMNNVTGNYTLTQGIDTMKINTNMPLSSQDVVYSETVWLVIILVGLAFLFLAAIFISYDRSVPYIAIILCGCVTWGTEWVAAYMTPLVGYTQVYQQIIATATSGTVTVGSANTLYINEVVVYTQGQFAMWALYGMGAAGFVVIIAGVCFAFGWLHARGLKEVDKGNYVEPDAGSGIPDPDYGAGYKKTGKS